MSTRERTERETNTFGLTEQAKEWHENVRVMLVMEKMSPVIIIYVGNLVYLVFCFVFNSFLFSAFSFNLCTAHISV